MIALAALAACGTDGPDPRLKFRVARSELTLGEVWWNTAEIPVAPLSLLNLSEQSLLVTPLRYDGPGAGPLVWRDYADFTEVRPGESTTIFVTLAPDGTGWATGAGAADLVVEVGIAWNDPSDFDLAPEWFHEDLTVPVTYALDCDLDGDGDEAAFCGGPDCDDDGVAVTGEPGCP